ncbi:MAG: IS66 family transposase [Polyangiaceae bacterium]|nr:IS66 family transposase [Polyangiaceae bacterium]
MQGIRAHGRTAVDIDDRRLVGFCARCARSVAGRVAEKVIASQYINADDTGLPVLERDHPNGVKRGHLWAYSGAGLVAFHYTPNWKADGPAEFLDGFRGHLQGDGYAGYEKALRDAMDGDTEIVPAERRLGCGMHIRRKFEEAAKLGDVRAAVAINFFKAIYNLEREYKEHKLSSEDRLAQRTLRSVPLVDELYQWIRDVKPQAIPKTPLYDAARYAEKQEAAWRRCFSDGQFEIDNGEAERRLRWVALGRKNFLFAGSDAGAESACVCAMHASALSVARARQASGVVGRADTVQQPGADGAS